MSAFSVAVDTAEKTLRKNGLKIDGILDGDACFYFLCDYSNGGEYDSIWILSKKDGSFAKKHFTEVLLSDSKINTYREVSIKEVREYK